MSYGATGREIYDRQLSAGMTRDHGEYSREFSSDYLAKSCASAAADTQPIIYLIKYCT